MIKPDEVAHAQAPAAAGGASDGARGRGGRGGGRGGVRGRGGRGRGAGGVGRGGAAAAAAGKPIDAKPTADSPAAAQAGGAPAATHKPRPERKIPKAMEEEEKAALDPILAKIAEQDKKIAAVQAKIDSAKGAKGSEKGQVIEQLKAISAHKGKAFSDNKALIQQSKDLRARQQALRTAINNVKERLPFKRTQADDFISRNLEEIDKRIAVGEAQQGAGQLSLREEKQKVAEIDGLRRQKKEITDMGAQVAELKNVDAQLAALDVQLKEFRSNIDALKAQEEELQKELAAHKEGGAKYVDIGAFIEQRNTLWNGRHALVDQHNAEFARLDDKRKKYFADERAKQQKEWEERQKAREAFNEERRLKREAYAAEKAKELPFEQELDTCNHLLKYLEPILASSKDEEAPAAAAAADAKPAAAGGAVPAAANGKQPSNKKAAAKKKKANPSDKLTHAWKYYQAFEKLSLQPPSMVAELEASINAIRSKKDEYIKQQKAHEAAVKAKEEADKAKAAAAASAPAAADAPVAEPAPTEEESNDEAPVAPVEP